MKWQSITLRLRHTHKLTQHLLDVAKCMMLAGFMVVILFLFTVCSNFLHPYVLPQSPFSPIKSAVAAVSNSFFIDMLAMELPRSQQIRPQLTFSQENTILFFFRLLTNLNPRDPKSFLAAEMPGMQVNQTTVLRSSKAPNPSEPIDLEPLPGIIETNYPPEQRIDAHANSSKPTWIPQPSIQDNPRVAFIYQTHSNESFLPELSGTVEPGRAYHEQINITLVGKRLAEQLHQYGVGAMHSDRIYPNEVSDFSYPKSYQYSLETLREAMASHPQLAYFFDIHRDSSNRERTTIQLQGEDYAQVYFIIGGKNKNWKQNEQFANQIHQILEQQAPGLSKGIHAKSGKESNGIYNQHVSHNSILIEIGGPYNSLAECYRTVDLLAPAIAEVIMQAKQVNGNG